LTFIQRIQILKMLSQVYAAEPGPYQQQAADIYTELRKNVIDNVYKVGARSYTQHMLIFFAGI